MAEAAVKVTDRPASLQRTTDLFVAAPSSAPTSARSMLQRSADARGLQSSADSIELPLARPLASSAEAHPFTLQGSWETPEVPLQRAAYPPGEPTVMRATVASMPAEAASTGLPGTSHAGAQIEELAEELWERIHSRFRSELLVERERAGLLSDRR
jgi:hypothetical protein